MNKTRRWIPLPIEFKGIWYSQAYGGFNIYLRERFEPKLAPDRLLEQLRKDAYNDILFFWYK